MVFINATVIEYIKMTSQSLSRTTPTFTGCRWEPDADQVLKRQHAGKEAAVLGPDFSYSFPPAPVHDSYQSEGVKHCVEVHTLPNDVDPQQQTRLWKTHEIKYEGHLSRTLIVKHLSVSRHSLVLYLESKLVKKVIDEIFDEVDDADVQVLPGYIVEDDTGRGRQQFVPQSEILLMAVDGCFKS